jgi:hypothetical protein
MCGEKCQFTLNSLSYNSSGATATRNSLDCRDLPSEPLTLRGHDAGIIGSHRLPNTRVAECYFKEIPGHVMSIYLTFTGVKRVRKTNNLYLEELALINSAMNAAMITLKADNRKALDKYRDVINKFTKVETPVRGEYKKYQSNSKKSLGPKVMSIFAQYFDISLKAICEDDNISKYMTSTYSGMHFDEGDEGLSLTKLEEAAISLNRGVHFTASLAGIKEVFKENPKYMREFSGTADDQCTQTKMTSWVNQAVSDAYDFLRNDVFFTPEMNSDHANHFEISDPYHFDIGLEVSPTFRTKHSFLLDMRKAKERLVDVLTDGRWESLFRNQPAIAESPVQTVDLLTAEDQLIFDVGETISPDDVHGLEHYAAHVGESDFDEALGDAMEIEPDGDISQASMYQDYKRLGVNTYEKMLSNGKIGGVHSGQPLLYFKEDTDNMTFSNITPRKIIPGRMGMAVTGGQIYDPATMSDMLTKQRKNVDDFAALPNLMARVVSSSPGDLDCQRKELFAGFSALSMNCDKFVTDIHDSLNNSSQHSARFEMFFLSTLRPEVCDIEFPTFKLEELLYLAPHDQLVKEFQKDLTEHMTLVRKFTANLVFDDRTSIVDPSKLSPCVKTCLVFCCEIICALIGTRGFQGRVMKAVKDQYFTNENAGSFFNLPEECRVHLTTEHKRSPSMIYGVDPKLLALPKVQVYILLFFIVRKFAVLNP